MEGDPSLAFSLLPFTKGIGDIPCLNSAAGDPQLRVARLFWSPGSSTNTGPLSPYTLRGSPTWGHHFPSDCCPVYLRWPTGSIWESFWSSRTLTNTRRGGRLGRRIRCSPPVADTLKAFPQNPPQPSSVSQTPTCIAFPRGGNTMMSHLLVLASWVAQLAAGCLHCCKSSADPLSWPLSARRLHLQNVLGPLALSPTMVTCFLLSAAHTHARWSTNRLGSLWGNAAIDLGARIHHVRQKPQMR